MKRISAIDPATLGGAALANNWTCGLTLLDGDGLDITANATDDAAGLDGGKVTSDKLTQAWYESLGFDMSIWQVSAGKLTLKNVGYKSVSGKTLKRGYKTYRRK